MNRRCLNTYLVSAVFLILFVPKGKYLLLWLKWFPKVSLIVLIHKSLALVLGEISYFARNAIDKKVE